MVVPMCYVSDVVCVCACVRVQVTEGDPAQSLQHVRARVDSGLGNIHNNSSSSHHLRGGAVANGGGGGSDSGESRV